MTDAELTRMVGEIVEWWPLENELAFGKTTAKVRIEHLHSTLAEIKRLRERVAELEAPMEIVDVMPPDYSTLTEKDL